MRTVVRGLWYEDCGMRTGMLTGSMAASLHLDELLFHEVDVG